MARINQDWKYDYEEGTFPASPSKMQEIVNGHNDLYEGTDELILKNVKSYNLIQNNIPSQEIQGVKVTRERDKSLTLSGTSTAAFRIYLFADEINLKKGVYTFSSNKSGSVSANIYITMSAENTDDDFNLNPFSAERKIITLEKETKFINCNLYVGANRTFTNFNIKPMLHEGEENKPYVSHFDLERLQNSVNEVVLFDNKNGSNAESISLVGDTTNAIDAEIYFKSNDGYCGYIKVDSPLNKIVNCSVDSVFNSIWYTKSTAFKVEKDKLSIVNKGQIAKSSASTTITDASNIYITKVVCHYRN